ncbi:polysaccharide deacetylase family protein [Consotaella aegiceratis]|uniref:polysaccharide deacetylase family protein n=1 Tax=Consotaella aegiceratis TaxID=3097961 RepID=UPI002F407CEC
MNLRSNAIALADWLAVRSGAAHLLHRTHGGLGCAFMFHSVVRSTEEWLHQDIRFPERALDDLLTLCRRQGIDIVNTDEALLRLRNRVPAPFVVFTFDDGYRDNLQRVLPLFERHGAKFSVFVTTGMIDRTLDYWWGGLLDLVKRHETIDAAPLGLRLSTRTHREKERALRRLTRWVEADVDARTPTLASLFRQYGVSATDRLNDDALSFEELRQLARSPLVTIGGHTVTHRPLATLNDAEAVRDIGENRRFLEEAIDREVAHFAFPHGDAAACSPRTAALLKAEGFRSGYSTRKGSLFPEHAAAPFLLPRGAMNPRRADVVHFQAQLAGLHRWLVDPAGSPFDPETISIEYQ